MNQVPVLQSMLSAYQPPTDAEAFGRILQSAGKNPDANLAKFRVPPPELIFADSFE